MPRLFRFAALALAGLASFAISGCTIYGEKKPPTLASTTSAEQYERIFWQIVEKQQWNKLPPLFSASLAWNVNGTTLGAGEVVAHLQSQNIKDVIISDLSVQPNGPDMTVVYTMQFADKTSSAGCAGQSRALSVWQQVRGSYILIAHSEQPKGGTCVAS